MVVRTETKLFQSKQNLKLVGRCAVQQKKVYFKLQKTAICIQYLPLNKMVIKWFANDTYIKKNRRTNTALLPFILKRCFHFYVEPIRMEVAASYFLYFHSVTVLECMYCSPRHKHWQTDIPVNQLNTCLLDTHSPAIQSRSSSAEANFTN